MRLLAVFTVLLSFGLLVTPVMAEDEFGSRFSADAPSALKDPEEALAEIAPAAGDEQPDEQTQEVEATDDEPEVEAQDQ